MTLAHDTRHGARRLARDWRFTAAAVLILGLGIGANTASFSVINATLFRESLLADPDRLVEIYQNGRDGSPGLNSYPAYKDIADYSQVFAGTAATSIPVPVHFRDQGAVRVAVAEYTTATYPAVLGLRPSLGRWFDAGEDTPGAAIVAIVGHHTWTRKFGSDPAVIGRTIWMEGVPVTIVGVGPAGHNSTINIGIITDFYLPVSSLPALGGPPHVLERRPVEAAFFVKARLREGVTVAQAKSTMDNLGARLAKEYPDQDWGKGISVMASSDVRIHPQADLPVASLATVLLVVVGLVLAIACSNLATLLLVRGAARAKEVSIRLALGASRRQLVRHLLTESLMLSVAGGAAGCVLAWWGVRALGAVELPIAVDFSVDVRVLGFAVSLSLITGVLFGLAPALKATKIDLVPTLRDDGGPRSADRRWFTLKNALVVSQVTISVVLLSVATLGIQVLLAARAQRVGYAVDGIAILQTDARYAGYSPADAASTYDELRRRVATIPGVQSAVSIAGAPMQTTGLPIVVDGGGADTEAIVKADAIWAAPGFFETLQIPILFGRGLDARDRAGSGRVVVISESMARQHFGSISPLGRRFRIDQDPNWIEVVGVARDTKTADVYGDLVDPTPYLFYRSATQWDQLPNTVVARTSVDAASLVGAMQRELRAMDPALPVMAARTMAELIEESLVAPAALTGFLGVLGALGVSLAAIGLYAVVAFAVSRRAREIGIRMALGARSRQVVWSVAREVAILLGVGTGVGLMIAMAVILLIRAFWAPDPGPALYRPGLDPVAVLALSGFMAAVGVAAAYVPASRAARMDPAIALRRD